MFKNINTKHKHIHIIFLFLFSFIPIETAFSQAELPSRVELKNGDLIWIRGKGDHVVYNANQDEHLWRLKKQKFLEKNKKNEELTTHIEQFTYKQFRLKYFYDFDISKGETDFSNQHRGLSVGHVAIVRIENGERYIIEAANSNLGVRVIKLEEWLRGLNGDTAFWVGRFKNLDQKSIKEIVAVANKQDKKKYDFWNFNLADDASFYCSKLIWYAFYKVVGKALDDNPTPNRYIWYSPKQMHKSKYINVIYGKSPY